MSVSGPNKNIPRTFLFVLIAMALGPSCVFSQTDLEPVPDSLPESYDFGADSFQSEPDALEAASNAADAGDYAGAVGILERAKVLFPDSPAVLNQLGDLFFDRGFFEMAVEEYEAAEHVISNDPGLLYKLSDCYGRLNDEAKSIEYLKRLVTISPDDKDALNDLGWMYFKTHRLDEGIRLIIDATEKLGVNRDFAMTLGTLYAERYDYSESKRQYQSAIDASRRDGMRHFSSIAHYNLSLLESSFRKYEEALTEADASLAEEERSSGYLARGELRLKRQDFSGTFHDYRKAFALDRTPLSKIDTASACVDSGRLDEAVAYLDEVSRQKSHPWMVNFGTDMASFTQELKRLYAEVYENMAERERLRPKDGLLDVIAGFLKSLFYRLLSLWHDLSYRKLSRSVAESYARSGNAFNADTNYYRAFQRYPAVAERYLKSAAAFETALVPSATASYDFELGALNGDESLLERALAASDPDWERDQISAVLVELARLRLARGKLDAARTALERLYLVNRGAFRGHGLGLPVDLDVSGLDAAFGNALRATLRGSGMSMATSAEASSFAYVLSVQATGSGFAYTVTTRDSGVVLGSGRLDASGGIGAAALADFIIRSLHQVDG